MSLVTGDHPPLVAGQPLATSWLVRRQTLFVYEADADELVKLVPPALVLKEARPGIGLFAIETLQYMPGHFGDMSHALEVVLTVMVEPNLRLAMPMPRFSLYVVSVLSSSRAFVDEESVLLRVPMQHSPGLHLAYSPDGASVDITDNGAPIVSCRNTGTPTKFVPKINWGMIYTDKGDEIHQGVFRWDGEVFEHQRRGDYGTFHPHAMFRGLDLRRIHGGYRQMSSNPSVPAKIGYYHLGPLAR